MSTKSPIIRFLHVLSIFLPGDYLKTAFYLNIIARPRKVFRMFLNSFYRMDHIYDVLREFKNTFKGTFSVLEFGTADGYSFTKMLYATKYLGMSDRVVVHTFDSFEGMPATNDFRDKDLIGADNWIEGQYQGRYEVLQAYCRKRYKNYKIHKGYFEDTLDDELLKSLKKNLPILIWIDCDYYSSARTVFERLIPYIPNGCVIYFDDFDFNFGSRFTGEARLVHEVNHGKLGDDIELVLDRNLSLDTNRVYRFFKSNSEIHYDRLYKKNVATRVHKRTSDSPLP